MKRFGGFKQATITYVAAALVVVLSVATAVSVVATSRSSDKVVDAANARAEFRMLGIELANASDLLTNEVRAFAVSQNDTHLEAYWHEIDNTKTRDRVVARLTELKAPQQELDLIVEAKKNSDALVETETRAMRLVLEAKGVVEVAMPSAVASYRLSDADAALSSEAKLATARSILFGQKYLADKSIIMEPLAKFQEMMNARAEANFESAETRGDSARNWLAAAVILLFAAIGGVLWVFHSQIGREIVGYGRALRERSSDDSMRLMPAGTLELRQLAYELNRQFEVSKELLAAIEQSSQRTISAIQSDTHSAVDAIGEISTIIDRISSIQTVIASAVEEQTVTTAEIASNITDAATGTDMIAERISMVADAARVRGINSDARNAAERRFGVASSEESHETVAVS